MKGISELLLDFFNVSIILLLLPLLAFSQSTTQFGPNDFLIIEDGVNGFFATLESGDRFSREHDVIGDVNGDGVLDIAVGARSDDDGAIDAGAVYILFMNSDCTVQSNQKISMLEGGFTDVLSESSFFGYGIAGIGDYDNDGIPDIAVSASMVPTNSIYIIHLNNDGTVKNYVKNANINTQGLSAIGDINGDGKIDLVACNSGSNIGGTDRGAIQILFFDSNSQVINANTVDINSMQGGFGTGLEDGDRFGGREVSMLGDLDNDGNPEMAVGAFMSDGGKGAVWILSLDATTFNVVSKVKITEGLGGFSDILTDSSNPNGTSGASFGHAMCAPGDLNGDGIPDLITGANQQDEGWGYILYLNADKTVKTYTRINNTDGGFGLTLAAEERFSRSISFIGDLKGDGTISVNVGGGAGTTGILYILNFKPCEITEIAGFNRWSGGATLFSNWNHGSQMITGDSLTYEQCVFKSFETLATNMTYNPLDGRCICKDSTATLVVSTELSTAYINECYNNVVLALNPTALFDVETTFEGNALLSWSAMENGDTDFIEIQRTNNTFEWETIERVGINASFYVDQAPFIGVTYYRLKVVNKEGSIDYSPIESIEINLEDHMRIFPNPVVETCHLEFGTTNLLPAELNLRIIDSSGRTIKSFVKAKSNSISLPVDQLLPGIYFLQIDIDIPTKIPALKFVIN